MAGTGGAGGLKVLLNGNKLPVKNFLEYVKLHTASKPMVREATTPATCTGTVRAPARLCARLARQPAWAAPRPVDGGGRGLGQHSCALPCQGFLQKAARAAARVGLSSNKSLLKP